MGNVDHSEISLMSSTKFVVYVSLGSLRMERDFEIPHFNDIVSSAVCRSARSYLGKRKKESIYWISIRKYFSCNCTVIDGQR